MLEYTLIDDYADYDDHVCRPKPCCDIEKELDSLDWSPCDIATSYEDCLDRLVSMFCLKLIPPSAQQSSDENGEEYSECYPDRWVYASKEIIHMYICITTLSIRKARMEII